MCVRVSRTTAGGVSAAPCHTGLCWCSPGTGNLPLRKMRILDKRKLRLSWLVCGRARGCFQICHPSVLDPPLNPDLPTPGPRHLHTMLPDRTWNAWGQGPLLCVLVAECQHAPQFMETLAEGEGPSLPSRLIIEYLYSDKYKERHKGHQATEVAVLSPR